MSAVYRAKLWDFEEWAMISLDGEIDEETLEHMEKVLDSALGSAPNLTVQKLGDDGEWEELGE